MLRVWTEGEWSIWQGNHDRNKPSANCLRHMCPDDSDGLCACRTSQCVDCKVTVPDEVRGFFNLVLWGSE